jgi:NAD(P)-dependent dehydrogenase (short-subunit alcohol dehydrogenase family)
LRAKLQGKVVIVTGGASGIGRAAVELLLEAGCKVTIADLNELAGKEIVSQTSTSGAQKRIQFVRTDVSSESNVKTMVERTVAEFGKLDAAINCAGFPPQNKLVHEISAEQWEKSESVNLRGMFFCIKHQIIAMQKSGGGSIVALSSTAATSAVPGSSDYCATKSGINGLVRAAALDYADKGIRINCVMPGAAMTPMFMACNEANPSFPELAKALPIKRIAAPVEIAAGAVWLISDDASYVTGVVLPVDGGISAV